MNRRRVEEWCDIISGMTWIVRISCAAMLVAGAASAQVVPAGWQVVKDLKNLCQIAVPADWTPDKLVKSFVTAADKKANAVIHALPRSEEHTSELQSLRH